MGKITELRQEMKRVVGSLDRRWLKAASGELCGRLAALLEAEAGGIEHVLAWIPYFAGEADLTPFIADHAGRFTVYLPRVLPGQGMTFLSLGEGWEEVVMRGDFGLGAPRSPPGDVYDPAFAPSTLVLVPGLAFDRAGSRLARGQAFYDNFLSRSGMQYAVKVGVAWSLQVMPSLPAGAGRVKMDWVCHERGYFAREESA